jgi:hypothetical protein
VNHLLTAEEVIDEEDEYDMEDEDSYSPAKNFREAADQDAIIGKRIKRSIPDPDGDLMDEQSS